MFLNWVDYVIISFFLLLSALVGIYHGCIRSKQQTTKEFLIASSQMGILPTAMSSFVSLISAGTLLGVPVEIYNFGTQYLLYIFGWFVGTYLTVNIFIPKFRQIGSLSINAYLEQRFSLAVRLAVTLSFVMVTILFMAINLYGPGIALSQVTGLSLWLGIGACGLVCTFYTTIGGVKAVIWTDAIQAVIIFAGIILSIVFGLIENGGIGNVFETSFSGNRLNFPSLSLNPSIRYTVFGLLVGSSLYSTAAFATVQFSAQRFLCVKSTQAAQKVAWLSYILISLVLLMCALVALILYTKYSQCDPFLAKRIGRPDQLYPFFVVQIFGKYPGLTGLFIGSILSASLSTISSCINSMTALILEDIYKPISSFPILSDKRQALFSKILSIIVGVLTTLIAFLMLKIENNINVIVYQIAGSFGPPALGVFLLGLFAPRVNSKNVLFAFIISLAFQTWVLTGSTLTIRQHAKFHGRLPLSIQGCVAPLNSTQAMIVNEKTNPLLPLYSMSFLWYNINGVVVVAILGLVSSLIFGGNDPKSIDKKLLCTWKDIFGRGEPVTDAFGETEFMEFELEKLPVARD